MAHRGGLREGSVNSNLSSDLVRGVFRVDPRDNVLIALRDLQKGERVTFLGESLQLQSTIPAKHKFTTQRLTAGTDVIMYGVLVGKAREHIEAGELLTTRNLVHHASPFQKKSREQSWSPPDITAWKDRTFAGYYRLDG
jgi:altronate hydrolase